MPLYFYDPCTDLIGIIHSGWQGTVNNIVDKTIKHLMEFENINPDNLKFIIGPSIKKNSFEVNKDVYKLFLEQKDFNDSVIFPKDDKWLIDTVQYNLNILVKNGIPKNNIFISNIDTYTTEELFSYRRDKITGRMLGVIKR